MQSILRILLVTNNSGKSKNGNDYSINEAHCVLLNEDGTAAGVGVIVLRKSLEGIAKPGADYAASFSLEIPKYGLNQGRIVAVVSDLQPLPANYKFKPAAAVVPESKVSL